MKNLISLQDTIKLVPKDEYALSQHRHEVCISYGTILSNLRKSMVEYQKDIMLMTNQTPKSLSHGTSFEANLATCNLMMQLDEVIDLPFKRSG